MFNNCTVLQDGQFEALHKPYLVKCSTKGESDCQRRPLRYILIICNQFDQILLNKFN